MGEKREKSSHTGARSLSVCVLDVALAAKANQMQHTLALCHYVSGTARVKPEAPRLCMRRPLYSSNSLQMFLIYSRVSGPAVRPLDMTASFFFCFKEKEGFMVSRQLLTPMDFLCVLD